MFRSLQQNSPYKLTLSGTIYKQNKRYKIWLWGDHRENLKEKWANEKNEWKNDLMKKWHEKNDLKEKWP